MIIHKVEERRCTRRHVPSSFSYKEETRPLCGARAGPAKHLGITGRETNRRPFGHGVVTIHSGSYWIINTLGFTRFAGFRSDLISYACVGVVSGDIGKAKKE
ncbi:hypothetical protein [Aneurinibacillus aneurinilyticus]|uniref:hypothetical protein n=1 Tax=Aneurinibacillus aneurinilyticus TaxID=1391 RepID=UPI0023F922F5|nr:hypothetical protein [Aneurinibacillus aneurinilyticus]MCI1695812.1 hypothetical protein [Aneurinibacillus aneurinilyticus]